MGEGGRCCLPGNGILIILLVRLVTGHGQGNGGEVDEWRNGFVDVELEERVNELRVIISFVVT